MKRLGHFKSLLEQRERFEYPKAFLDFWKQLIAEFVETTKSASWHGTPVLKVSDNTRKFMEADPGLYYELVQHFPKSEHMKNAYQVWYSLDPKRHAELQFSSSK
jgi:hypothetical protein